MNTNDGPNCNQKSLSVERHVNRSVLPVNAKDSMTREDNFHYGFVNWLRNVVRDGWSGKMSPVYFPCRPNDKVSRILSPRWLNAGMAWDGGCWTVGISAYRKNDSEYSLSDIWETGDHLQAYFLTQRAARGILRRAAEKGVPIPDDLIQPLRAIAYSKQPTNTVRLTKRRL